MARGEKRSAARLAAVQALYQMDIAGKGVAEAMAEFEAHWIGREIEGVSFRPAEAAFFRDILAGVIREQTAIDRRVDAALAQGWPLKRVEAVLRAVLRAGAYEILFRRDVPARAAISEYVDVTRAFYGEDEPGLVNAVLDAVARETRGDELEKRA
jgi:transcription antitermination protein NusB